MHVADDQRSASADMTTGGTIRSTAGTPRSTACRNHSTVRTIQRCVVAICSTDPAVHCRDTNIA
jgi:hypothetical protein